MEKMRYQYRNIIKLVVETVTPLSVSSGTKGLRTDSIVARDVNGLPYISGAALTGVIRHAVKDVGFDDSFFGFPAEPDKENLGKGSEIIFSSAQIVDENSNAVEELINHKSDYLQCFEELPIRQHVRIDERGVAKKQGKFDEEVVYKGTRFCFEIELLSSEQNDQNLKRVLDELAKDTIRIGGGTRKGFGEIKIVDNKYQFKQFDLSKQEDLNAYIQKTSSLNDKFWDSISPECVSLDAQNEDKTWSEYKLELTPDDFFLFSSGFGDDEADMTPVTESFIDWSTGKPEMKEDAILIPGSSVKGAVAHRVAYHYNKLKDVSIEKLNVSGIPELLKKDYRFPDDFDSTKLECWQKMAVDYNPAVRVLFGYTSQDEKEQKRGNVLISDVIQGRYDDKNKKILNHVLIDRFTGGTIDGALFSENIIVGSGEIYTLVFKVKNDVLEDESVEKAFKEALLDITKGLLPLGGGTNRGHGCFNGKLYKNLEEVKA